MRARQSPAAGRAVGRRGSAPAPGAAWAGLAVFAVIVGAEHLLEAGLDPASHEISEYANTRTGALMVVGFIGWSLSLAATSWVAGSGAHARLVATLLGAAALGMLVTASFATETSAGRLPPGQTLTAGGRLHDIGSGVTSLALLAAAAVSLYTLRDRRGYCRRTALLLAGAGVATAVLVPLGADVGGLRQRLVLLAACAWQATLLAVAREPPISR